MRSSGVEDFDDVAYAEGPRLGFVDVVLAENDALQLAGVAGFLVYLFSFAAVQLGQLNGNGAAYSVLNVLAAVLVALSLIDQFNLASALIQGSWIVIGLAGLALRAWSRARANANFPTQFGTDQ